MAEARQVLKEENTAAIPAKSDGNASDGIVAAATNAAGTAKGIVDPTDKNGDKNAPWLSSGTNSFQNPPATAVAANNFLWCFIDAYANKQKTTIARLMASEGVEIRGDKLCSFKFLMDSKLDYTISHTWETGTDPIANATKKVVDFVNNNAAIQLAARASDIYNSASNVQWSQTNLKNAGYKITEALQSNGAQLRMDEAKLFTKTEKQVVTFTFELTAYGSKKGSTYAEKLYQEVVLPVKSLQWCSSALATESFGIEYPNIFSISVKSDNSKPLMTMDYAILTGIQPTFNDPWVDGMPTSCSLSLTFENLLPIYKQTFQDGGWNGLK